MTKFEQLSIFDIELEPQKSPAEIRQEELINKNKGNSFWVEFCDNLILVDENGNYDEVPHKAFIPEYFTVDNPRRRRTWRTQQNAKKFNNLKTAVLDAVKKLRNREVGSMYFVSSHYSSDEESYEIRGSRTVSQSVLGITKETDGFKVDIHCLQYNASRNIFFKDQDAFKEVKARNNLPESWLVTPKQRMTPIMKKIEEIKSNYNVSDILFKGQFNNVEKEANLNILNGFYELLSEVVNVHAIEPVNVVFGDVRGHSSATYSNNTRTISLHRHSISSFFHEFFHHIDYRTSYKRYRMEVNNYKNLWEKLLNSETLLKFKEEYEKRFEEHKVDNPSFYRQDREYYNYYLKPLEITARFFEEYILYKFEKEIEDLYKKNDKSFYRHKRDYTKEEYLKYNFYMDMFLEDMEIKVPDLIAASK